MTTIKSLTKNSENAGNKRNKNPKRTCNSAPQKNNPLYLYDFSVQEKKTAIPHEIMISKLKITTANLNAISGLKKRSPPNNRSKSPFTRKKDLSLSII